MANLKNIVVVGNTRLIGETNAGKITATQIVKAGGTSSQFLKADGSVDSNNYSADLTQVTYSQLKSLRDSSGLTPGMQYQITDYNCTVGSHISSTYRSAGNVFDIIVTADSENTLNENARAIQHSGDTYFANSNLAAWELKYSLDNDDSRFTWADTGSTGRGVIYWMKDEGNNECPYDFKNIQYKPGANATAGTVADVYYYTFSVATGSNDATITDHSLNTLCCSNIIKKTINNNNKYCLYLNIFRNTSSAHYCSCNVLGENCYYNLFNSNCYYNKFGNNCTSNWLGCQCNNNSFSNNCVGNRMYDFCWSNTLFFGCSNIILNANCCRNVFGNRCEFITMVHQNMESINIEENNCYLRLFGSNQSNITISKGFSSDGSLKDIQLIGQTGFQTIYLASGGTKYVDVENHQILMPTVAKDTTLATIDDVNVVNRMFGNLASLSSYELKKIFGLGTSTSTTYISALYIDDFEDGHGGDEYAQDFGYNGIVDYIEDVCNDISAANHVGTNILVPTCDTLEYDGVEYRLWAGFTGSNDAWSQSSLHGLTNLDLDYQTLYNNSMEVDVTNYYSPFVIVFTGGDLEEGTIYSEDLNVNYRLICVKTLELSNNPIETHSSAITKIYLDNFHDYGLYMSMNGTNTTTMNDYIQYVRNEENLDQTWIYINDTIEYEGVTYKIYADEATNAYGGLLPSGMTYQDLYPHTLECNGENINTPYSPFVVRWLDGDINIYDGDDPADKYSTIIAID